MRVFVGYGYNQRDSWIEEHFFPILQCMGFVIAHGKDMHGQVLQPEVQDRIDRSDAAIGFFTVRDGQGEADFNSHIWVRDEMVYALAKGKTILPVMEVGARVPDGLLGDRQNIPLRPDDRLACVAEVIGALGRRNIRRIRLEPEDDQMRRDLYRWRRDQGFVIQYRTRDADGLESRYRDGRLELFEQGFYLNASDVPRRAYVDIVGVLNNQTVFGSGWAAADAVSVKIN